MTNEEKQLLLSDICARLPYGVNGLITVHRTMSENSTIKCVIDGKLYDRFANLQDSWYDNIPSIKPYLRSMSNMTNEEKKEIEEILEYSFHVTDKGNIVSNDWKDGAVFTSQYDAFKIMDFCNKHHLDYRGLIPMGLALEAPKDMYIKMDFK